MAAYCKQLCILACFITLLVPCAAAAQIRSGDLTIFSVTAYPGISNPGPALDARGRTIMVPGFAIDLYVTLRNDGAPDAITRVTIPGTSVAGVINWYLGNQYPAALPVSLPSGTTTILRPDGPFLRLYGVNKAYQHGETFPVTFQFQKAPDAIVYVTVTER